MASFSVSVSETLAHLCLRSTPYGQAGINLLIMTHCWNILCQISLSFGESLAFLSGFMLLCEVLLLGDVVMGFRWLVAARCRPTHLGNFPGVGLRRLMNSLGERFRLHQRIVVICVVVGCLGRVPLCLLRKIDIRRRHFGLAEGAARTLVEVFEEHVVAGGARGTTGLFPLHDLLGVGDLLILAELADGRALAPIRVVDVDGAGLPLSVFLFDLGEADVL